MRRIPASVQALDARFYAGYRSESDLLHDVVEKHLRPGVRVLDLGCGGGKKYGQDYRGPARRVVGLDLDPAMWENTLLDDRVYASAEALPFRDESFDGVYSRYVFEHLPRPDLVFGELARVLRPGGVVIVLTPNLWHYVPTISRLTPSWFHKYFNARLRGRGEADTFPTTYKANTRRALRRLAEAAGLTEREVRMVEPRPNYLMWAAVPFVLGVAYERLVNSTEWLQDLRVNILGVYAKPGSVTHPAQADDAEATGYGASTRHPPNRASGMDFDGPVQKFLRQNGFGDRLLCPWTARAGGIE